MALEKDFCIIYTADCALYKFQDKINWGTPEVDRAEGAHILLAAHIKEDGTEEFTTVDSVPYTSKLEYDIPNTIDGHWIAELLRFPIYDINTNYAKEIKDVNGVITNYANLMYHSGTNKFYKAIENVLNVAPDEVDGSLYWQEITSFTLDEIRKNTTIAVYDYKYLYDCRSRKCVKDLLIGMGCNCSDDNKIKAYDKARVLLQGAQALADDQKFTLAETNIRVLEKRCGKC